MPIQRKTKMRIAYWVLLAGFIALIIFQNGTFFEAEQSLRLNLGFYKYETPKLPSFIFFVAFFLFGILVTYFSSLFKHFKDAKTIKLLKAKELSLVETVASLEARLQDQNKTGPELSEPSVFVSPSGENTVADGVTEAK